MESPLALMQGRFWSELRTICYRAYQVWLMVPVSRKIAFAGAGLLMAAASVTAVAIPVALGQLVDRLSHGVMAEAPGDVLFRTAATFLGLIAGMVVFRELINVARRYLVENTCTRIEKHMNVQVISHVMQVDLATLTHEKIGSLNARIFRSIDGYMRFLRGGFLDFFPVVFTGLLALSVALYKAPWIGLVMLLVIPASITLTAWQLLSQKDIRLKLIRSREHVDGTVVELLGGLDYVRAADTHKEEVQRVSTFAERRRKDEMKHHVAMSFFGAAKALTEGFFHLVVLSLAVYLAVQGKTTFGDVLLFSALFLSVMTPLAEVHRILDEGHEASMRVADLVEMLAQPIDPSCRTETHTTMTLDDAAPIVRVDGLHVNYLSSYGQLIHAVKGIDLSIRNGETVGVVGRSGCGKSTFIKVLLRIVHASAGEVFLKGMPLAAVSRQTISQLIGYVGQSPFVFAGTIEQNIRYGCARPCLPEDIGRAAQRACIHDEIMLMPDGYHTQLAERGANLSGGQRQRIALARIFLKDPPLLILDEATSALDTISERNVQRAIDAARADRTVILVAHRLSTLSDADRILVFDQGKIVEDGPYEELVRQGGVFAEMVASAEGNQQPLAPPSEARLHEAS